MKLKLKDGWRTHYIKTKGLKTEGFKTEGFDIEGFNVSQEGEGSALQYELSLKTEWFKTAIAGAKSNIFASWIKDQLIDDRDISTIKNPH